jgi:hypothetical protein
MSQEKVDVVRRLLSVAIGFKHTLFCRRCTHSTPLGGTTS